MLDEFKYDVFLSYNSKDKPKVKRLAEQLRRAGLRVWFDEWVIKAGDNIYLAIERGLEATRVQVLCLSPAALGSDWVGLERSTVLFRDPSNASRRFIPLLLETCQLPDTLRRYKYIDYSGETKGPFDELLEELNTRSSEAKAEEESESIAFAASIRSHMGTLHRSVEKLTLEQYRVIQLLRGQRRVRISGCAGSGKTLVAAEKAIRLSQAGVSTLFLCHNPLLAERITGMTQGSGVHVKAFGNWVAALTGETSAGSSKLWTNYEEPEPHSLDRAFDALAQQGDSRFEAIVVDEGQDFRHEWWALVEAALTDPQSGILYIFHDDHQALLPYRSSYPIVGPILDLSRNCRNAGRIYEMMRHLHPQSPEAESTLKDLGEAMIQVYQRGDETNVVEEAVRRIVGAAGDESLVVLLGGDLSFEKSPFFNRSIQVSVSQLWQMEVRRKFHRSFRVCDKRGVVFPRGGWAEVQSRLDGLSTKPYPTAQDIELVRKLAKSFRVDGQVRRQIMDNPHFRNAMRWGEKEGMLKLSRSFRAPVLAAEVIMHFERSDWDHGIPQPHTVRFREHTRADPADAIPVYYVGAFKGLEADFVLMFVEGAAPFPVQEVYVGVSRARLLLALLVDTETMGSLPATLRPQWGRS